MEGMVRVEWNSKKRIVVEGDFEDVASAIRHLKVTFTDYLTIYLGKRWLCSMRRDGGELVNAKLKPTDRLIIWSH